jgi:hypothetical protein
MYEFHVWIGLSDSTFEQDNSQVEAVATSLAALIEVQQWPAASFAVQLLNGQYFLIGNGLVNRRRDESAFLEMLLERVTESLPESWGLVYDRDDEMPVPPGPNAFRVRTIARGVMSERLDPFLSPTMPTIED